MLESVTWHFSATRFETEAAFDAAVRAEQVELRGDASQWQPDTVVVEGPVVELQFTAFLKAPGLSPNETLLEAPGFFENPANANRAGLFEAELLVRLEARDGRVFTARELLFQVHNHLAGRDLGAHRFFEGLTALAAGAAPRFRLRCGS